MFLAISLCFSFSLFSKLFVKIHFSKAIVQIANAFSLSFNRTVFWRTIRSRDWNTAAFAISPRSSNCKLVHVVAFVCLIALRVHSNRVISLLYVTYISTMSTMSTVSTLLFLVI